MASFNSDFSSDFAIGMAAATALSQTIKEINLEAKATKAKATKAKATKAKATKAEAQNQISFTDYGVKLTPKASVLMFRVNSENKDRSEELIAKAEKLQAPKTQVKDVKTPASNRALTFKIAI